MFNKTKIAFAAALILGIAPAALAGSKRDGFNPVYHPNSFGKAYGSVAQKQTNGAPRLQIHEPTYMYIQSEGYRNSIGR